ncbi:hypothetical protein [Actinophytocola sp.]|uniref:hypothetical protein n=1 Tax=Actinophytocola sp. TaxID=1872138 RepID=UPI003D6AC1AA
MDPFSADIVATSRRRVLADEAEVSRTARATRDSAEEPLPAPRPKVGTARARRLVAWQG